MPNFDPEKLQKWTSGEWKSGFPLTISGFSCDTRTLQAGELFVALKAVIKKFADVKLTVVGEGNRLKEYKSRVADLNLTDHVEFTGWKTSAEIQNLSAQSSLGVFPSRIESFGLSVVEALAATLPVVASRGGAIPENIEDGVTGKLVPVKNSDALAGAIISALEDPANSSKIAKEARLAIKQKFSWEKAAENTLSLYEEILHK